jgi:hypothetical protein
MLALAAFTAQAAPSKCDLQASDLAAAYQKCADGCTRRDALHLAIMYQMAFDCMEKPGEPNHSKAAELLWQLMQQWATKDHPNWPHD